MTRFVAVCMITLIMGLTPLSYAAEPQVFDDAHRREIYEANRKSVATALGYTLLFPPLGDFYAEEYAWGAISGVLLAFTLIFAGYGFSSDQPRFYGWAAVSGASAYILAGTTAYFGVQAYNADLRQGLKVQAQHRAPGLTVSFSW